MKSIVFDTGTIISLVTNNILWILPHLKKQMRGKFLLSESVKQEIIDNPLKSKKFKLEALIVQDYLREGTFTLAKNKFSKEKTDEMLNLANSCFSARGHNVKVVDRAEIETLIVVLQNKADAMVMDERTLRLLVENPGKLEHVLSSRLRTKVEMNKNNAKRFQELTKDIKIIRSAELAYIAYKMKLLDKYITAKKVLDTTLRKELLEGTLWALKLNGCSISQEEINEMIRNG
jgi:hypothetical protein